MKVAITGSSGLIGSALCGALRGGGHTVIHVVRRQAGAGEIGWDPAQGIVDRSGFEGVDAVVNLAGAGIGDKRWTQERKQLIVDSRVESTGLLARALAGLDNGPSVLLSGSAIGYYGDRGDDPLTEADDPGHGFLSDTCAAWEDAAQPAVEAGLRTAFLRTGIVQATGGGALAKTLPPFKLGLGGRLGPGTQWWSWISIDDTVRAIVYLLTSDHAGPVNLTAPNPVRNQDYTTALGHALGRPTLFPIPKIGPKLLLGAELANALLYQSQRVLPAALEADGFEFRHPMIEDCFAAVLADPELA